MKEKITSSITFVFSMILFAWIILSYAEITFSDKMENPAYHNANIFIIIETMCAAEI